MPYGVAHNFRIVPEFTLVKIVSVRERECLNFYIPRFKPITHLSA